MVNNTKGKQMANPTVLYKIGKQVKIDGDDFDYIIVDGSEVEDTIKDGWCLTTTEAKEALIEAEIISNDKPTREEIETKATELGIKFRSNTTDETILAKIEEALNELD